MTNCPTCHAPLLRSDALIRGHVVLGCRRNCRKFTVEVEGCEAAWVDGGPGWLDRLRAIVAEQVATRAILDSDDDDPRWQTMEVAG
jgi:hypothetical protein